MTEPSAQLKQRLASQRTTAVATDSDGVAIEKSESIVNLTKPSLYSIYNENSEIALSKDEEGEDPEQVALYATRTRLNAEADATALESSRSSVPVILIKFVVKVLVLAVCAYFYNEVTTYIRNNHIKLDANTFQPLYLTEMMLVRSFKGVRPLEYLVPADKPTWNTANLNYALVLVVEGLILGTFTPVVDFAMPPEVNVRVLSSNPDPSKRNKPSVVFNEILRSLITFVGISYAIRNIEWASPLQVSVVWSLLSPSLWLLLDGTVAGLMSSLSVTIYACLFVYFTNMEVFAGYGEYQIPEMVAIWLWTSSFFFCGMIIFGKIGRALF